jgi:predicted nucleic acid-binding protein
MIAYADSSVLIAWFHPDDEFAQPVTEWVRGHVTDFLWNPLLQLEVRHNLRKLRSTYARAAWNALRAAERSRLRFGREKLHDLIDDADELSANQAMNIGAGTWDFFHVAAAIRQRAQTFATCDKLQADLANAVNVPNVKLFRV